MANFELVNFIDNSQDKDKLNDVTSIADNSVNFDVTNETSPYLLSQGTKIFLNSVELDNVVYCSISTDSNTTIGINLTQDQFNLLKQLLHNNVQLSIPRFNFNETLTLNKLDITISVRKLVLLFIHLS